jgi:basic membrane protein A and related proteins
VRKPVFFAVFAALALSLAIVASSVAKPSSPKAESDITVALISDIGRFTDRGFNQSQLQGLNKAKTNLGITALPKASNSVSDYIPNMTSAVRQKADLIISAGFLLADATGSMAKRFPDTNFAITDYPVQAEPFTVKGKLVTPNVVGLTYAANEGGCLVGVLAARKAQAAGKKVIGAVGGLKIPPVDIWIAGYKKCAQMAVPGTKVLVGYSQDFVATDKCKTVAENQIAQGAQVLFQVAGGCGLGTLKAADEANRWSIGVDVDQYRFGKRVLTSAVKRVDTGVYQAIQAVQKGTFKGGTNLTFNLKNGGIGLGKMNPAVTAADKKAINSYKTRIIAGKLKLPSSL